MSTQTETPTLTRDQADTLADIVNGADPRGRYAGRTSDYIKDLAALYRQGLTQTMSHAPNILRHYVTQAGRDYVADRADKAIAAGEYEREHAEIVNGIQGRDRSRAAVLAVIRVAENMGVTVQEAFDLIWPEG